MNKKIIACIIAGVIVAGAGIYFVKNNSKQNNNTTVTAENETTDSNEDSNSNDETKEKEEAAQDNTNNEEAAKNDTNNGEAAQTVTNNGGDSEVKNNNAAPGNPYTDQNANENIDIDSAAKADIATNNDEAVKKVLDFYLGEDDAFVKNMVKVKLNKNSDNTVSITKADGDSNIYYAGISPLTDQSSDGLLITIENYNESDKTYTYNLKDFSQVKSGKTDDTVDTGIIPERGNVTSTQNK